MEKYNNIICVTKPELTDGVPGAAKISERQIMSNAAYESYVKRNPLVRLRMGKGKNSPALLAFHSLRADLKAMVVAKYGDPEKMVKRGGLVGLYIEDVRAAEYFSRILPSGKKLSPAKVREYTANASMLGTIARLMNNRKLLRQVAGDTTRGLWEEISREVNDLQPEYGYKLPENPRRLKMKVEAFQAGGYEILINGGFGNKNRLKVNDNLERLILSLYCLPEKPYVSTVLDLYLRFLSGEIDVVALGTGEVFDRSDFYTEDGTPIVISESTIWAYINMPKNRIIVDKYRNDQKYYNDFVRPHHWRKAPEYSFSKISMDDRDLPRKMPNGERVKAYYAYDVCSGAIIGRSYSRSKDKELFIDCMRDMFRFLNRGGYGIPVEVEVEHHLVNKFKNDLMKAGTVFPLVRWCCPGNSQEKYAETLNRLKKYGYEKRYQQGIGRFYAKLEANRPPQEKVFDEANNHYKTKTFTFDQLVADDLHTIELYNNALHPNQKKYPGMSRLDVLNKFRNPAMAKYDASFLAQFIGERVETSIKRNSTATVQYSEYQLPAPQLISRLEPNNYDVTAFYMPVEAGEEITEVHIYQKGKFICTCQKLALYSSAKCEWTDKDEKAYNDQAAYVSAFDQMSKEDRTTKVRIIDAATIAEIEKVESKIVQHDALTGDRSFDDFTPPDYDDYDFSPDAMRAMAINRL